MNKYTKSIFYIIQAIITAWNIYISSGITELIYETAMYDYGDGCRWGAESMGWLWANPFTFFISLGLLDGIFICITIIGLYNTIKRRYRKAFYYLILPTIIGLMFVHILSW